MSPVAVAADKRFRRAHVKPTRTRRSWRAVARRAAPILLILAALLYCFRYGEAIAAHVHVLRVDAVVVRGNERLSTDDVLSRLNGLHGESLLWTDLDSWRRRLLTSRWVRDATLRRLLPSTVEVVVSERRPIGIARIAGQMYLVDDRGVIIDEYGPQYAEFDLPIVDGLAVKDGAGVASDGRRAELAARVIAALSAQPEVSRRLSQVDVQNLHNAAVILNGDNAVIHLGDQRFLSRLQAYLELAPALRDRVPDIDYVDLRVEGRIYVRPTEKPVMAAAPGRKRRK